MSGNGFFEYLEGLVPCPAPQVRNSEETLVINPEFTLWKLINTQLLTCITASLSPTTLPYILGLRNVHEVWESLSNRYNSLSRNHVQEIKSKLYSITQTSTIENYVDTIKEYTQKLIAASSPIDEDDLIFHTLRGLPKVFNGLRTTVREKITRGEHVTFDEVVTMINAENQQLLQESSTVTDNGTVLIAAHGQHSGSTKVFDPTSSLTQTFGHLGLNAQSGIPQQVTYSSQMRSTNGSVLGPAPRLYLRLHNLSSFLILLEVTKEREEDLDNLVKFVVVQFILPTVVTKKIPLFSPITKLFPGELLGLLLHPGSTVCIILILSQYINLKLSQCINLNILNNNILLTVRITNLNSSLRTWFNLL